MPWKTIYKNKKDAKVERTLVLLLGGSIYDDGGGVRIANRRRRGDELSRKKQDVHLEEHLFQQDFHAIAQFFERTNATVWRCAPTHLRSSRSEAFDLINEFFQLDNEKHLLFIGVVMEEYIQVIGDLQLVVILLVVI